MFSFPPITPLVKKLIIALLAAYVVGLVLQNFAGVSILPLALDPLSLGPLTPVQLVSSVFVPSRNALSFVISLLFIWLMLSPFESSFGPRRAATLASWGVLASGLSAIVLAQIVPGAAHLQAGPEDISQAAFAAAARLAWNRRASLFGMFTLTGQQLILIAVAFSVLQFLESKDLQGLVTSLAALGAGVGYIQYLSRTPRPPSKKRTSGARFRVVRGGGGGGANASEDGDRPKWLN